MMDEMRKRFIIAQALGVAVRHLSTWPDLDRPDSNIADMRELLATEYKAEARMVRPEG